MKEIKVEDIFNQEKRDAVKKAILEHKKKLNYQTWLRKYFSKKDDYWVRTDLPDDFSEYDKEILDTEYNLYLKDQTEDPYL